MSKAGHFIGDSLGGFIGDTLTKWYSLFSDGSKVPFVEEPPVPETGPTKLIGAWLETGIGDIIDCTGDWPRGLLKFTPDIATIANTSLAFWIGADGSIIQLYNSNLTTMRLRVRTVGSVFVADCIVAYNTGDAIGGLDSYIERVGDDITLSINGVVSTVSMDLSAGCNIDQMKITSASRVLTSEYYSINFPIFDNFNFENRVLSKFDETGNQFVGSINGRVLTVGSALNTVLPFPYLTYEVLVPTHSIQYIGDSIGAQGDPAEEYFKQTEVYYDNIGYGFVEWINRSIVGKDCFDGASDSFDWASEAGGHAPTATMNSSFCIANGATRIFHLLNANSVKRFDQTVDGMIACLQSVIDDCIANSVDLVIGGGYPRRESLALENERTVEYNTRAKALATQYGFKFFDCTTIMSLGPTEYYMDESKTVDGSHQNEEGNHDLAFGSNGANGLVRTLGWSPYLVHDVDGNGDII